MNIYIVNNSEEGFTSDSSGAIATHVAEVSAAARRTGVAPIVLTARRPGTPIDAPQPTYLRPQALTDISVVRRALDRLARLRGWRRAGSCAYYWAVRRALRAGPPGHRAVLLHNDPDIAERLSLEEPDAHVSHLFHNAPDRPFVAHGRVRHLAVSSWLASVVEAQTGREVHVVPNGVDSRLFRPTETGEDTTPCICFLGRTGREKGLDLLLSALVKLSVETTAFRLLVIGANTWGEDVDDEYQRGLRTQFHDLERMGVKVVRAGHVPRPRLPVLLASADVLVVPSRWEEPACLALTEGMASGLAVVAAQSGGMPEYGQDACLWFDRGDASDLAQQLRRLLADPDLRDVYAARARDRALELTWDATWRALRPWLTAEEQSR